MVLTDFQQRLLLKLIEDRPEATALARALITQTSENVTALTAAELLYRGAYAESYIEDVCDGFWKDQVGRVQGDPVDSSLEVFFLCSAPSSLVCTQAQAVQLMELGFSQIWLNFCDATEQQVMFPPYPAAMSTVVTDKTQPIVHPRRPTSHPRGGATEAMLRLKLQETLARKIAECEQLRAERDQFLLQHNQPRMSHR